MEILEGRLKHQVSLLVPTRVLGSLLFQGNMQVLVTYGGDPIPKSPFTVGVAAPLDLSRIQFNGLENSKCVEWRGGRVIEEQSRSFQRQFIEEQILPYETAVRQAHD